MAHLSLSLLGSFQATLDEEPVTGFEANKVRALLAYLAVEADQPHRREALAGLFWPDRPDQAAFANLRNALANLRKVIGDRDAIPPFLLVTRETIQFNSMSDHWLDVAAFRALVETTEADQTAGHRLEEAVALYRGRFLEGFSVRSSPAFDDWSLLVRERLHRQVLATLRRLIAHYEGCGEVARACEVAWRQVELGPWAEEAHRELMRLLAVSGRRAAALAQYETCRRLLKEELGVGLAVETTRLYERIRDGEIKETGGREAGRHNLPAQLVPFVGREAVLSQIEDRLRDPGCRLLTLIGPGGCGKTRLALEAAANQIDCFHHGVFFVSLAPFQSANAIVPAVAQALGFLFYGGSDPGQQLLDYLRQKSLLLILDSYEHLLVHREPSALPVPRPEGVPNAAEGSAIEEARVERNLRRPASSLSRDSQRDGTGIVTEILKTAPDVKVLVTSRAGLDVQGEHVFPITGMDVPDLTSAVSIDVDRASQYDAVQLFLQGARRAQPGFEPTADDLTHIIRVCRLVAGIPLGILLAATWIKMLSPAEIADQVVGQGPDEIGQGLDFLDTNWRNVPERQRSMRAVFHRSWNLASEREQKVFAGLSVFRGGFTWQAAQSIVGASLRELMALVNRSLLHRALIASTGLRTGGRYDLWHELLRQYAAERLDQWPDIGETLRDRHGAYYASALRQWGEDLKGPRQQAALAEIEADIDNARAAWYWMIGRGQVTRLGQAIQGLCRFYEWKGLWQEGEVTCQTTARELADQDVLVVSDESEPVGPGEGVRVLGLILAWQGTFSLGQGHTASALRLLRQSLRLLSSPTLADRDTSPERAFALLQLGRSMWRSDPEACGQLCEQSRALYRALGDQWGEACALELLGALNYAAPLHAFDRARQMYQESLTIRRRLGDQRGIARSLAGLGDVAGHLGHLEESIRLIQESVEIHRQVGDTAGMARGLYESGYRLMEHGEFSKAHSIMERVIAIERDIGMRRDLIYAHTILGWTKQNLGSYEQARVQYRIALALAQELGFQYGAGMAFFGLGTASMREGTYTEARQLLAQSDVAYQEAGHLSGVGLRTVCSAVASRALGQPSLARCQLRAALRRASETGHFTDTVFAVSVMALLLADSGAVERAVEVYALASRYPYVSQSRWWYDCTGRHIAALAATLPPEVVAAAQERGRARDLWATVGELLGELEATVQDEDRMTEADH